MLTPLLEAQVLLEIAWAQDCALAVGVTLLWDGELVRGQQGGWGLGQRHVGVVSLLSEGQTLVPRWRSRANPAEE